MCQAHFPKVLRVFAHIWHKTPQTPAFALPSIGVEYRSRRKYVKLRNKQDYGDPDIGGNWEPPDTGAGDGLPEG